MKQATARFVSYTLLSEQYTGVLITELDGSWDIIRKGVSVNKELVDSVAVLNDSEATLMAYSSSERPFLKRKDSN